MPRASLDIADVFRAHGPAWRDASRGRLRDGPTSGTSHLLSLALAETRDGPVPVLEGKAETTLGYLGLLSMRALGRDFARPHPRNDLAMDGRRAHNAC